MLNLKKVLAFAVAFTMVLGSVAFAAFTDVPATESYSEAVDVLSGLSLLKGYEDGTFKPDGTITRAEFAAVVCRAHGLEAAASGAAGDKVFNDVPGDHWASGYIKLANQSGFILGYGDGNFGPEDPVTYEQAIKMLIASMGYTVKADSLGGYPAGYLVIANQEGVTIGATGKIGEPAKRAIVARLTYNALDVKLMEQIKFGSEPEWGIPTNPSTLLSSKLKIAKVEGNVTGINFDVDNVDKISFVITKGDSYIDDDRFETNDSFNNDLYVGSTDAKSLRGYSCVAYIDSEADDATILAIAPKSGKNKILTLNGKQFADPFVVKTASTVPSTLEYYKTSKDVDSVTTKVDIESGLKVYKNLVQVTIPTDVDDVIVPYGANGGYTLIDSDNNGKYETIIYKVYESLLVYDINAKTKVIEADPPSSKIFTSYDDTFLRLQNSADTTTYSISKDGVAAKFEDIKKGDILDVAESKDSGNTFYEILISSDKTVTGTVTEKDNENSEVTIGGKAYKISDPSAYADIKLGDEGTFKLDSFGKIAAMDATSTAKSYAFIINSSEASSGLDENFDVMMLTQKGEVVVNHFASKVKFEGITKDLKADVADFRTLFDAKGSYNFGGTVGTVSYFNRLVAYKLNSSNEITDLRTKDFDDKDIELVGISNAEYSESKGKLGSYYIADDVNLFKTNDANYSTSKSDYSVVTTSSLTDEDTYEGMVIIDGDKNIIAGALKNFPTSVAGNAPVMLVTGISNANDENGDDIIRITGFLNGERVTVSTTIEDDLRIIDFAGDTVPASFANIVKGSLIQYSVNAAEAVDTIRILYGSTAPKYVVDVQYDDNEKDTVSGTMNGGAFTDKVNGFIYEGKVKEFKSSTIIFDNDDELVVRSAQSYLYNLSNERGYAEVSFKDIETTKLATTTNTNDDTLVIYNYDGVSLVALIIDANGDTEF